MSSDISSNLYDWSTTASSNQPDGTDSISNLDDNLRELQAVLRGFLFSKGADIASAAAPDPKITGLLHVITGTTTLTGLATAVPGMWKVFKFAANPVLKNSATFNLPGATDVQAATGDYMLAFSTTSTGSWDVAFHEPRLRQKIGQFTRDLTATAGTQGVTGLGFKPEKVTFLAGITGETTMSIGIDDGTNHFIIGDYHQTTANEYLVNSSYSIAGVVAGGTNYLQSGYIQSMDADGFTIVWSKLGTPSGTLTVNYIAER